MYVWSLSTQVHSYYTWDKVINNNLEWLWMMMMHSKLILFATTP
jgi:hypothetical protein